MTDFSQNDLHSRVCHLERSLRTARLIAAMALISVIALATQAFRPPTAASFEEIRTRKLLVVDRNGVVRVMIAEDADDAQRTNRSAGLTVFDSTGAERGGFSTFSDGRVVLAMDAPVGIGSPVRDRLGMEVWPNGGSYVMLMDNRNQGIVRMHSDGNGTGGLRLFQWDTLRRVVRSRTLTYEGELLDSSRMSGR